MHDTENPPGQVRYLRDVIRKYEDEERWERSKEDAATLPLPDTEKRLERLKSALLGVLCDGKLSYEEAVNASIKIISENT